MRICLVCTEKLPVPPVRGGAIQIYLDGIMPWLSRVHQVTVVCRTDPALPEREERGGVAYVRLPAGEGVGEYYGHVARFLRTRRFDTVAVFNRPVHLLELSTAAAGARFILSLHNDMFNRDRLPPETARSVLERADAVVTISDHVRHQVDGLYPGFAPMLRTIRSGVDLGRFRPVWEGGARRVAVRRRLGLAGGPVVLHVSRLSLKKGNHLVLEAMAQVLRTHRDAQLLVVGSRWYGSDEPDEYTLGLRRMAEGLGGAVRFTGFVPPVELPDLYLAGDLFVCASQWAEPLARVHYEAMAAGLPIITTDRGGNAEVIQEGANGLIARPHDDSAAFAALMGRLLDDPPLRERMGRRGRELAAQRYTWDRVAAEWLAVLEGR